MAEISLAYLLYNEVSVQLMPISIMVLCLHDTYYGIQ